MLIQIDRAGFVAADDISAVWAQYENGMRKLHLKTKGGTELEVATFLTGLDPDDEAYRISCEANEILATMQGQKLLPVLKPKTTFTLRKPPEPPPPTDLIRFNDEISIPVYNILKIGKHKKSKMLDYQAGMVEVTLLNGMTIVTPPSYPETTDMQYARVLKDFERSHEHAAVQFRTLLKKYMEHVKQIESVDYVSDIGRSDSKVQFTEAEVNALNEIAKEVGNA